MCYMSKHIMTYRISIHPPIAKCIIMHVHVHIWRAVIDRGLMNWVSPIHYMEACHWGGFKNNFGLATCMFGFMYMYIHVAYIYT